MIDVYIHPLRSERDIDDILRIETLSFTRPWTREMYLAELEHGDVSFFYVARDAVGEAIGFCSWWLVLDEVHINNLAVLPEWRRQGIAGELLRLAVGRGLDEGAKRATLEVRASNVAARQLYERFGFTRAGVRKAYYTNPVEDALILWCDLGPAAQAAAGNAPGEC